MISLLLALLFQWLYVYVCVHSADICPSSYKPGRHSLREHSEMSKNTNIIFNQTMHSAQNNAGLSTSFQCIHKKMALRITRQIWELAIGN
jgi:hypothetical protein